MFSVASFPMSDDKETIEDRFARSIVRKLMDQPDAAWSFFIVFLNERSGWAVNRGHQKHLSIPAHSISFGISLFT